MKKKDYLTFITEEFLELLNTDEDIIYKKGWIDRHMVNGTTNKKYNGANSFILSMAKQKRGYQDNRWYTFNQIRKMKGCKLKQGSKSYPVSYFFPFDIEEKKYITWDEYNNLSSDKKAEDITIHFKTYAVFNGSDIEGLPEEVKEELAENQDVKYILDTLTNEMGVSWKEGKPSYDIMTDLISCPNKNDFVNTEEFERTKVYLLAKATSKEGRLNRSVNADEEKVEDNIICEIASSMYDIGEVTQEHINNQKAYLMRYKDMIEKKPSLLYHSIKKAQEVVDYFDDMLF